MLVDLESLSTGKVSLELESSSILEVIEMN